MGDEVKNVFVSHVHEDDSKLTDLKNLLGKHSYEIKDASINSEKPNNASNPDYIKSEILAPRINWAGAMIVLISPDTHKSDWVDWEIQYAEYKDKPIVGVWCPGATEADLPDNFEQYGNALVGWQGERIIDALNGKINNFEGPDGAPRNIQNTPRAEC